MPPPFIRPASTSTYRCQSAHKLLELDDRFSLFKRSRCNTVLDLAAAPGGFAQVALERMSALSPGAALPSPKVIGVDLRPIDPLPGLVAVRCDILRHQDVLRRVRDELALEEGEGEGEEDVGAARRSIGVVLHDGVSVVRGQRACSVTYGQCQMAMSALQLACAVLRAWGDPGTTGGPGEGRADAPLPFFVTKAMRCGHLPRVLRAAKSRFFAVKEHRPAACKPGSPETFLVMCGLKSPSNSSGAVFSLPPLPEDGPQRAGGVVWFCLGCGHTRIGCRPCPACSPG